MLTEEYLNMKKDINISFIIPIYNGEAFLDKCIKSLCNITSRSIEIILIDDGSSDNTLNICSKWAEFDDRIQIIAKENGGVSSARNVGIKKATGTWLTFIDADDWISEEFANIIENLDVSYDLIYYGIKRTENEKSYPKKSNQLEIGNESTALSIRKKLLNNDEKLSNRSVENMENILYTVPFGRFYKKAIIDDNNILFDETLPWGEDIVFNFQVLRYVKNILFCNQIGYYYRLHSLSITQRYNENAITYYKRMVEALKCILINEDKATQMSLNENYHLFVIRQYLFTAQRCTFNVDNKKSYKKRKQEVQDILEWNTMKEALKKANLSKFRITVRIPALFLKYDLINGLFLLYRIKRKLNKKKDY